MSKQPNSEEYQAKIRQAEEWVDQATERVGAITTQVGRQLQKFAAKAREEAEDIWAEAQHRRNRNRDNS